MGITDHIKQAANSRREYDEAFCAIVEEIQSEVRSYINKKYPKGMVGLPSVTDFVQETFNRIQEDLRQSNSKFLGMSTDEFKKAAKRVADDRLSNAKKSKSTKGPKLSDRNQNSALDSGHSPDLRVSNKEDAKFVVGLLIEEQEPLEILVTLLGLALQFSHRDIAETLARTNGALPKISDSKIGRILKNSTKRVRDRLLELGKEDIGPLAGD